MGSSSNSRRFARLTSNIRWFSSILLLFGGGGSAASARSRSAISSAHIGAVSTLFRNRYPSRWNCSTHSAIGTSVGGLFARYWLVIVAPIHTVSSWLLHSNLHGR